ncbi:MAG TPA: metallophosphoesterase family protein [Candidatus Limnocylindrales bacterium]|nr:metallophosphoesterase family protein [Candidatus Limnocylindrales bacterium]
MKFAILADIHANLEAFEAVLKHAKQQHCTSFAFLGDFVGYCADPKDCLDIVRALNAACVKGNHDEYCAGEFPLKGLNQKPAKAVEWTRNQLTAEDRQWLNALPYVQQVETFTIVHGTLDNPKRWRYVFDRMAASSSLAHQSTDVCFFGHTHVPVAFVRDTTVRGGTYTKFRIEPGKAYFINPGAVGQPRDNNPNAAYLSYDLEERVIELFRVPYHIATAQRKIREADLDV